MQTGDRDDATFRQLELRTTDVFGVKHIEYRVVGLLTAV